MSIEYPCVHWDEGKCKKFSDDKVTSWCVESPCKEQTPSNADCIRAMSDEEIAQWLCLHYSCTKCLGQELCTISDGKANGLLKWLKQPADRGEEK